MFLGADDHTVKRSETPDTYWSAGGGCAASRSSEGVRGSKSARDGWNHSAPCRSHPPCRVRAVRAPTSSCRLTSVPSRADRGVNRCPPQSTLDDAGLVHRTSLGTPTPLWPDLIPASPGLPLRAIQGGGAADAAVSLACCAHPHIHGPDGRRTSPNGRGRWRFDSSMGVGFGPSSTSSSRRIRCALALLHTPHLPSAPIVFSLTASRLVCCRRLWPPLPLPPLPHPSPPSPPPFNGRRRHRRRPLSPCPASGPRPTSTY